MRRIGVLLAACVVFAACGGGDDGDAAQTTTTRLTLLPTTTTTTVPPTTEAPSDPELVEDATTTVATTTTVVQDSTTTATVAPTSPPDTAPPVDPAVEALRLSADGIGAAVFSGEPEGVIAFLSSFIGPPSGDTGWVDPFEISACSGTELRVVSWGSLQLTFGDVSKVLQGRRHFFSFTYGQYGYDGTTVTPLDQSPPGLLTDDGVGLGTPILEVEFIYPGLEINPADDFVPPNFVVNDNLRGSVAGLADDSPVVQLIGGPSCADPT